MEVPEDLRSTPPSGASRPRSAAFSIALPFHLPPTFALNNSTLHASISYEVDVVERSSGSVLATTCMRVLSAPGPHIGPPPTGGSIERFAEQDLAECCWCCVVLCGWRMPVRGRASVLLNAESEHLCLSLIHI